VQGFTNRTRSARRRMQQIQRMTSAQRLQQQEIKYRELLRITGQVVQNARQVVEQTEGIGGMDVVAGLVIDGVRQQITSFCGLADRVIDQTRRRVIDGEQVPAGEKLYSIFEDHTDLIKRGKAQKPVEFGHKVFLAESAQGLITDYRVLEGNPADSDHVEASLERHQQLFQHPPECYAADRGFYSADNVQRCQQADVDQVCIPQRGGKKTAEQEALERSPAFKKAQRFRVGIEGRISVLFRGRGMKRCLAKGRERFEMLVGAAVLANNLMRIAQLLEDRKPKRRRAAA
jgi:IS5 family transposase